MKTLIADAGGTSTGWAYIDGGKATRFKTSGINPVAMSSQAIESVINDLADQLPQKPQRVEFYGAGCRDHVTCYKISSILHKKWGNELEVSVNSDLVGAAKALFGNKPGIACILGTGSNSGVYDGNKIIDNTPSLGYILGDEGSGAVIGKLFINRLFKQGFSGEVAERANALISDSLSDIIQNVYRGETPNRYLASFVPIVKSLIGFPEVEQLVVEQFKLFYQRNILRYNQPELPIGFVGSIACHFEPQLRQALPIEISSIVTDPLDAIVDNTICNQ